MCYITSIPSAPLVRSASCMLSCVQILTDVKVGRRPKFTNADRKAKMANMSCVDFTSVSADGSIPQCVTS